MRLQGRGFLYVLHGEAPSTLGTRWKSGLQHSLLFPELPAGSTAAGTAPAGHVLHTEWVTVCRTPRSKPTPAEHVWAQDSCQCKARAVPHHPITLESSEVFRTLCSCSAKVFSFNEKLRRTERYKPVKQTNWLSQGSSQKEQAY